MDIKSIFERLLKVEAKAETHGDRLLCVELETKHTKEKVDKMMGAGDKAVWVVITTILVAVLSLVIGKF